jgi:alpha-mannosidase
VHVAGDNRGQDHRLRLLFATDVPQPDVWADAAFGPVRRVPLAIGVEEAAVEHAPPTAPLHRYVSLFGPDRGFTLYSDGLAEYESMSDGTIAVTLARAVGELSRNDLPERPGHAGWPTATPAAQCVGPLAGEFGVHLHGPRDAATSAAIERVADDVLCPPVGFTLRAALAVPAPVQGVELTGRGLGFSAMKESDDGQWVVLRCVNVTDEPVDGSWNLPFDVREARASRLDETPLSELSSTGRSVSFRARPRDVVTILVR